MSPKSSPRSGRCDPLPRQLRLVEATERPFDGAGPGRGLEIVPPWVEDLHLPLAVTTPLDEFARRFEPPDSDGLDPSVLPEAPFGLWRLRTLHARTIEREEGLLEQGAAPLTEEPFAFEEVA